MINFDDVTGENMKKKKKKKIGLKFLISHIKY